MTRANKIQQDKQQPQEVEVEETVLGALIIEKDAILEVMDILTPESFYKNENKQIFQAITNLNNESKTIDILTVTQELKRMEMLEIVGGAYRLSILTNKTSSAANIVQHAMIIKQAEIKRNAIKLGSEIIDSAYSDSTDAVDITDYILNEAYNISSFTENTTVKTNAELLRELKSDIHSATESKGMTGMRTGIHDIDKLFGGYQPTDLIIKAARPAQGKTSQAICEAVNMSFECEEDVLFFSLEMGAKQLMARMASVTTGIPLHKIRNGNLTKEEWGAYNTGTSQLFSDKLIIIDNVFTLNGIKKVSKKLSLKRKIKAIYIDYLQLIEHKVAAGRNRENEISEISRALKMLAKELNVPVIALSQLSRAVESRGGEKIPMLSDLRDSGSIEQDADIVQFLYRPEYYKILEDAEGNSTHQVAYLIVAKHRNGSLKDIKMRFIGECTKFENWNEHGSFTPDNYTSSSSLPISNDFDVSSQDAKEKQDDLPY